VATTIEASSNSPPSSPDNQGIAVGECSLHRGRSTGTVGGCRTPLELREDCICCHACLSVSDATRHSPSAPRRRTLEAVPERPMRAEAADACKRKPDNGISWPLPFVALTIVPGANRSARPRNGPATPSPDTPWSSARTAARPHPRARAFRGRGLIRGRVAFPAARLDNPAARLTVTCEETLP